MTSRATVVLGDTPLSRAFLAASAVPLGLELREVRPVHRAFRPMVEEAAFGLTELAIVTAIQAVDHGRPVIPLPITLVARFQHAFLVQDSRRTNLGPQDLPGRRVAVRAFSQTTGAWLRTILETEHGVMSRDIEWVTQEGPHVVGAPEPPNVTRVPETVSLTRLLSEGTVDAAIFGNDLPDEEWLRPVIPNPEAAAQAGYRKSWIVQINHIVAVSRSLAARDPALVRGIRDGFDAAKASLPKAAPDLLPMGEAAMRSSVEVLLSSVYQQGLTTRPLSFEDVFGEAMALLG